MEGPGNRASFNRGDIVIGLVFTSELTYRFDFFVLPTPPPPPTLLFPFGNPKTKEGKRGKKRKEQNKGIISVLPIKKRTAQTDSGGEWNKPAPSESSRHGHV